jgi:hypothetical protein
MPMAYASEARIPKSRGKTSDSLKNVRLGQRTRGKKHLGRSTDIVIHASLPAPGANTY